jgi:hypothetical protein
MTTIRISKRTDVRGLTYLVGGQQFSGRLPAGDYRIVGECLVRYADLGIVKESQSVKLEQLEKGAHWYVAPNVLADLPEVPRVEYSAAQVAILDRTIDRIAAANFGAPNESQLRYQSWTAWINEAEVQTAFPKVRTAKGAESKSDKPADRFATAVVLRWRQRVGLESAA